MKKNIYTPTFINESINSIVKMDDALSIVEQEINNLTRLNEQYSEGKKKELNKLTRTASSNYEENLQRMALHLGDLYSLKNHLLDGIDKMKESE